MEALLQYLSAAFVIVPLILGILKKSYLNRGISLVFLLLIISFFLEIVNIWCGLNGVNNMLVFSIYTTVEFILFALFYKNFYDSIKKSFIHYLLIILFSCVATLDMFFINDYMTVNNFSSSLESIIFILYSLLAFFFIMKRLMFQNLLNTSFFWINIAILIYFAGNLFLFLFSNHLQKNDQAQYLAVYNIHSVTNIIYYILISIGFWKAARV